jgi:hypothetical protein
MCVVFFASRSATYVCRILLVTPIQHLLALPFSNTTSTRHAHLIERPATPVRGKGAARPAAIICNRCIPKINEDLFGKFRFSLTLSMRPYSESTANHLSGPRL